MTQQKNLRRLFSSIITPLSGTFGKNFWFEFISFTINEIQLLVMILSIAYIGSSNSSDPQQPPQTIPLNGIIFQLSSGYSLSVATIAIICIYFFTILTFLLLNAYFGQTPSLNYTNNFLMTFHRDYMATFLQQVFVISLSSDGILLEDKIKPGILLAINVAIGILSASFCFSFCDPNYALGMRNSRPHVVNFLFKILATTFLLVLKGTNNIIEFFLIGIWICYIVSSIRQILEYPFYNYKMTMYFSFWKSLHLASIISVILRRAFQENPAFTIFLAVILSSLISLAFLSLINRQINLVYQLDEKKIDKPQLVHIKFLALDAIHNQGGEFTIRRKIKLESLLLLSKIKLEDEQKLNATHMENHKLAAISGLNEIIMKKFAKNPLLVLQKVDYDLNSNQKLSIESIYAIEKLLSHSNLLIQTRAVKIRTQISKLLAETLHENYSLNFEEIANFYNQKNKFIYMIRDSMKAYLDFWDSYINNEKAYSLFLKSIEINHQAAKIQKVWSELKDKIDRNIKLEIKLYLIYLQCIRCAPYTARKVSKLLNISVLHEMKNKGNAKLGNNGPKSLSGYRSIAILANLKSETELFISTISRDITDLGYDELELIKKPLETLIPMFYKQKNFLKLVDEASQYFSHKDFTLFIKDNHGHPLPYKCLASPIVHDNKLFYMILLSPLEIQGDCFVISERGIILGASKSISKELKMNFNDAKDLRIDDVCSIKWSKKKDYISQNPEFEELNSIEQIMDIMDITIFSGEVLIPFRCFITKMGIDHGNKYVMYLEQSKRATTYILSRKLEADDSAACFSECNEREDIGKFINLDEICEFDNKEESNEGEASPNQKILRKETESETMSNNNPKSRKVEAVEVSIGSVKDSTNAENRKLERLVYSSFTNKRDYIFKYALYFQITVCLSIIMGFTLSAGSKLDRLPEIFLITKQLYDRYYYLWIWAFWNSQNLLLFAQDILGDRLEMTKEDYYYLCVSTELGNAQAILSVDQYIQSVIPSFESETRSRFYQPIRIKARENTSHIINVTFFEWDRVYSSSLLRIQEYTDLPPFAIGLDDIDLYFTSKNILDDHYIVQTDLQYVISDDIQMKVDNLAYVVKVIMAIVAVMAAIIVGWLVRIEFDYYMKKRLFIDAMYQIKEEEIVQDLSKIKMLVEEMAIDLNSLEAKIEKIQEATKVPAKKFKKNAKKSQLKSIQSFSKYVIILVVTILIEQVLLVVLSSTISININESRNIIGSIVSKSIQMDIIYQKIGILFLSLYEYIQGNNPTIKNKPYDVEFESDMAILSSSTNFYYSLLADLDDDLASSVAPIFTGDICLLVLGGEGCQGSVRSKMTSGLLGINAFMTDAISSIKIAYDTSNKTIEAKREVLYMDKYVDIEWAYWIYASPATQVIQTALREQVVRTIESAKMTMKNTIIIYTVAFVVFFLIAWRFIWGRIVKERLMVENMIKMIPQSVAMNNFYMKNYIFKISKDK